jgi:serine/threonine protein kinase
MDFGIARSSGGPVKGSRASVDVEISQLNRSSALMAGSTMAGSIIGTVEYMAPEQARAQPVDQRADIYAVGLILYDLLIGRHRSEHAESAIAELQGRILQAPPPSRTVDPSIPAPIDAIITRCLEPDPTSGSRRRPSCRRRSINRRKWQTAADHPPPHPADDGGGGP